jgi:hypothetical protein
MTLFSDAKFATGPREKHFGSPFPGHIGFVSQNEGDPTSFGDFPLDAQGTDFGWTIKRRTADVGPTGTRQE